MATIESLQADIIKLQADMKKLQKAVRKLAKSDEEPKEKKLNGFSKPMNLSKELTAFLEVSEDTMLARTEVTKLINKYVKEHNLQNPENKREFALDDKLKTIIKAQDNEQVTFFNLQKFMSPHYLNPAPAPVETPSAPETPTEPAPPPSTPVAEVAEPNKVIKKIVKTKVPKKA